MQTSDWTADKSIAMKELILVTGVGKDANEETIRNTIPEEQRQHVSKVSDYRTQDQGHLLDKNLGGLVQSQKWQPFY